MYLKTKEADDANLTFREFSLISQGVATYCIYTYIVQSVLPNNDI